MIQITPKYTEINQTYLDLKKHIDSIWPKNVKKEYIHEEGHLRKLLPNWCVIEIAPAKAREPWIYISLGTWELTKDELYEAGRYGIDFLITSPEQNIIHVKNLAWVASFHADPMYRLCLGDMMDIGEPWMPSATCDHFLVSYPHPFLEELETIKINDIYVSFWWLVPITAKEFEYANSQGVEALETLLEKNRVDSVDTKRKSVV